MSSLVKEGAKKILQTVGNFKESRKAKKILNLQKSSDEGKAQTGKILTDVDKIIQSGQAVKNPEKLLRKKKQLQVGDETVAVGPGTTETKVGIKQKVKVPEVPKETIEEFLTSFNNNTIPKKILADFNIDKITNNDDIFKMINGIAKGLKTSDVVKQTRGVRKQSTTKAAGTKLSKDNDFVLEVLGTKPGKMYNADQIYGIRQLLEAGAARTRYLAEKLNTVGADTTDVALKFRQHYALMAQIQKVLLGVKTETGRALNQFKIPSDASKKYSFLGGNIDEVNKRELLLEIGGFDEVQKVAELVIRTSDNTQLLKANRATGLFEFSKKTSDAIAESFINVILSNPLTHMRNGLGNWIAQAIVQAERKYANTFFSKTGQSGTGTNYMAAHSDIARAWGKHMAAKEIMSAMADIYKISGSKIESKMGKVTAQNFGIKNKTGAAAFDLFGKGITLNNLPTKMLKISDDYFKNREFRAELYELAFNDGMEMYHKGILDEKDLATWIASRVAHPTKELTDRAVAQARYVTFQTPLRDRQDLFRAGNVAQQFKNATTNVGPFSWFTNYYLPFVQTPTNIAGFVAERTPVLATFLTRYNSKINAGGKEAAIAKAQLQLGYIFYMATAPLGYYGVTRGSDIRKNVGALTGGKSLVQKTTKTQPLQIEIPIGFDEETGKTKYQRIGLRGFDPVAQMFANSANLGQMWSLMQGSFYNNIDVNNMQDSNYAQLLNDMQNFSIGFAFALGENLSNSTMLAGAGKMVNDTRKVIRGYDNDNSWKALKEVGSEYVSSYVPTVVREVGKYFNTDQQKLVTELEEYFKRNIAESDLWYDYDMRGRRYDKFQYFNQFERDYIDEELFNVMPKVTPVKDYATVPYGPKGLDLSVTVPLNSLEKSYTRKKAGQIFNGYMERMMQEPWYKNETDRVMKESFIKQQWQNAKSEAFNDLRIVQDIEIENDQGEIVTVNFGQSLMDRAEEMKNQEIINKQLGFRNLEE